MSEEKTKKKGAAATETTNGNGAATMPEPPAGLMEFQSDSFANCDGFWNIPKDGDDTPFIGETFHGVYLNEVRTKGGKPLDNPFFVFELLTTHKRITCKDENKNDVEQQVEAGHRVGCSSTWKSLSGLSRKAGHEVWMRYDGKRKLPNGRVAKNITVRISPKPVREIEQLSEQRNDEGDKDGDLPEGLRG